jgi:FdhD protein
MMSHLFPYFPAVIDFFPLCLDNDVKEMKGGDTVDLPITMKHHMIHFDGISLSEKEDEVVTEYALTLFINDEEFSTMVCTPADLEELVVGFLASEGLIKEIGQIHDISLDERQGFAHITTSNKLNFNQQFYNKRYITSCCGKSRQSFYFYNDAHTAKEVTAQIQISVHDAFRLLSRMQDMSTSFKTTGGVHNAALCSQKELLMMRTDIGRHNALDKIYGYCLKNGIALDDKIIAFSGRVSSEILLKVSKIGVAIVLSKSAPTALALEMAEDLGITVIGFIRKDKLNIYTHPKRIIEYLNT